MVLPRSSLAVDTDSSWMPWLPGPLASFVGSAAARAGDCLPDIARKDTRCHAGGAATLTCGLLCKCMQGGYASAAPYDAQ